MGSCDIWSRRAESGLPTNTYNHLLQVDSGHHFFGSLQPNMEQLQPNMEQQVQELSILEKMMFKDVFFTAALNEKEEEEEEEEEDGAVDQLKKLLGSDRLSLEQIQAFARSTSNAHQAKHTPLYMAAVTGNLACVKLLLPYSDLEQRGVFYGRLDTDRVLHRQDGVTALWGAALAGREEIVSYLLDRGANVNPKTDGQHWTPLRIACKLGHIEVVKSLLTNKTAANIEGVPTALLDAAENGKREVMEYLISRKDLVSIRDEILAWDNLGISFLLDDFDDIYRILRIWLHAIELKQQYLVKIPWNWEIFIPLCFRKTGCQLDFYDLMRLFKLSIRESEIWMTMSDEKGNWYSVEYLNSILLLILYLLESLTKLRPEISQTQDEDLIKETHRLVKLNPKGFYRQSLLHIACSAKPRIDCQSLNSHSVYKFPKLAVIKFLLEVGANPHTTDDLGNTLFHALDEHIPLSFGEETCKIFHCLLRAGVHWDSKNKAGKIFGSFGGRVAEQLIRDYSFQYTTLQCLSARVIRQHQIDFSGLPKILYHFVGHH